MPREVAYLIVGEKNKAEFVSYLKKWELLDGIEVVDCSGEVYDWVESHQKSLDQPSLDLPILVSFVFDNNKLTQEKIIRNGQGFINYVRAVVSKKMKERSEEAKPKKQLHPSKFTSDPRGEPPSQFFEDRSEEEPQKIHPSRFAGGPKDEQPKLMTEELNAEPPEEVIMRIQKSESDLNRMKSKKLKPNTEFQPRETPILKQKAGILSLRTS